MSSERRSYRDDDREERRSSRDSRDRDDDRGGRRGRDEDRGSSRGRDRDDDRGGRRSGGRYEYRQRDPGDTKRRSESGANDYDKFINPSIKMWKPNDGENRIRILPPTWENAKHYGHDIWVHYGVGPDRQSYLCLEKMKGEPDPIEEERAEARRDGDEEFAKQIEHKRRVLVYLIDRDHEKEGVQAWAMPWTLDRDIVKVSIDRTNGEVLPIDHPYEGYDVTFEKKGSKNRTEYLGVSIARRTSELGKDEWLDFAQDHPLPEQLVFYPYDHIAKVFNGAGSPKGGRDRDDDRDDDRGSRSRDRDRDEDRGSSRERDRDRGEPGRSRERDDDRSSSRGRDRSADPDELTWDSIHAMTWAEMEDLIEVQDLDIKAKDAKDDEDLADWICEELKIKKAEPTTRRRVVTDDGDSGSRLSRMRRERED